MQRPASGRTGPAITAPPAFPVASQPDIVRASQKDEYYRRLLSDQIFDVTNRVFGARVALQNQAELRLLADVVFFVCKCVNGRDERGKKKKKRRKIRERRKCAKCVVVSSRLCFQSFH